MKMVYIICGYPFAGKTTSVHALQNYDDKKSHVINLDETMVERGIDVSKPITKK